MASDVTLTSSRVAGLPVTAREDRISDVHAAILRVDPDIVRTVQQLALVVVDEHRVAAIRTDLPQLAVHVRRRDEIAPAIEVHPVRAAGAFQEQRDLVAASVPAIDAVIRLIGEEHVPLAVDRGTFRETEAALDPHELPVAAHQAQRIVDFDWNDFALGWPVIAPISRGHRVHVARAGQGAQHCDENASVHLHVLSLV